MRVLLFGASSGIRTPDTLLKRQVLCQRCSPHGQKSLLRKAFYGFFCSLKSAFSVVRPPAFLLYILFV